MKPTMVTRAAAVLSNSTNNPLDALARKAKQSMGSAVDRSRMNPANIK